MTKAFHLMIWITKIFCVLFGLLSSHLVFAEDNGKHLFILSGQSNMVRLDPSISFRPAVESAYGADNVIVVKYALSGRPIRRWYRDWKSSDGAILNFRGSTKVVLRQNARLMLRFIKQLLSGEEIQLNGEGYETMMEHVYEAIGDSQIKTITFIWMHGERDAREGYGNVYQQSLAGLHKQLEDEFGREDVNFILGRISDWDMENKVYPDWTLVREEQVRYAESNAKTEWIDTDEFNSGYSEFEQREFKEDLHYSTEGYRKFSQLLADRAIYLIKK